MPYKIIKDKKIYFEEYGEGEVLVLLNGIMMSTASWLPFVDTLSKGYKVLLIDLIDQGRSDKAEDEYDQGMHVEMLKELFQELSYDKIHLFGVSYGGEVAQLFAIKYGYMLKSLILSNTTSYTNKSMQDLERAWDYAASTYDGSIFFSITIPSIYSNQFYEENYKWLKEREKQFNKLLNRDWYDGFRRAVKSAHNFNTTNELHNIQAPTLIISSDLDTITPVEYQEVLYKNIPDAKWVLIKNSGHASMYEKPYEFLSVLIGFLNTLDFKVEAL